MKYVWNARLLTRAIAGVRPAFKMRRAGFILAASLISVGGFAGCGDDATNDDSSGAGADSDTTHPNPGGSSGSNSGGSVGATSGSDSGGMTNAGSGADSGAGPDETSAPSTRAFIGKQVGGIENLTVPPDDKSIPVPPDDPKRPGRYKTTPAKKFLGKLLFHDPVRTARVNINAAQPLDLPAGTAFGGTVSASDPSVQLVHDATLQTGSCGSCHIGEAAGKAGQVIGFNVGGEGRGYTDENGGFVPRRRAMSILKKQRTQPLYPGDALFDVLPTLTDVWMLNGERIVYTPSLFYHNNDPVPPDLKLLMSGRLDQLDSVGRHSPGLIGFAFNNRLLFGGFGGEPPSAPGSLNPMNDPAGENLTLLLLDAHRMLNFQAAELLKIPAFVQAFRDAFPEEAAQADAKKDMTLLVNDQTEFRAQATFLRTAVTRDTPFDKFLAGDDVAMTPSQLHGARLFFTEAKDGGAGCFNCHSGPMLNKQADDPDVAGIGEFVEENFINVGIGDHPIQALNALARGHSTAYHAEDNGRAEITQNPEDNFKFRSQTMRQLRVGRTFFHNGGLTRVRDVVSYFNAGVPQDPTAGSADTIDPRFTYPRGSGSKPGLGLSEAQVDDITDFLENSLYDDSFLETFQPNADDLKYSKNHPSLAKAGAKDGLLLSESAIDDNDLLSRRDQGLEFSDVTARATIALSSSSAKKDVWLITNKTDTVIDTHLLVVVTGLPAGITVDAPETTTGKPALGGVASGLTAGTPYYRVFLPQGVISPGQSISMTVTRSGGGSSDSYAMQLLSGQGAP